jgi:beta,beta-carotene 9',10'-dioxygenase
MIGFTSAPAGTWNQDAPIEGAIPRWLSGRFIHTGPAQFEVGEHRFRHWFDGLAMLTSVEIDEGRAHFRSRPLDTEARRRDLEAGDIELGEFGTSPTRGLFGRLAARLQPPRATDNANVNVFALGNALVAATETPRRIAFDPWTLETRGELCFDDGLDGNLETAHPQCDPETGTTYSYATTFGRESRVDLIALPADSWRRRLVAKLPTPRPAYVHSFGMSRQHLVYVEPPLVVHPLRMRLSAKPFYERYRWRPELGTRVRIVSKESGRLVADVQAPPFFFFHHVDAVDLGDRITVDLVTYPDASVLEALTLDKLCSRRPPQAVGTLQRMTIALGGRTTTVELAPLSSVPIELPRIHPDRRTYGYRYVYGVSSHDPLTFFDRLVRIDVGGGPTMAFERPGWYPGEPVFVPAPDATRENQGVVLSMVVDSERKRGRVIVLDGETFELLGSVLLPQHIPFHFHGDFVPTRRPPESIV